MLPTTERAPYTEEHVARLDASDLEHISRLTIHWEFDHLAEMMYELAAPNGFWRIIDPANSHPDNGRDRVWLYEWDYTEEVDDLNSQCTWSDRATMKDAIRFLLYLDGRDPPADETG
ncbi:hypothetical protein CLAFUW4_04384 [Fulvia fulva]|uniref:Uncharacterized protein n=1 Tax=Passalora fulva TaxID=5499 RepID=A0A9Q8LFG2_PASFU|nr:uncharacterized protein CLAFUR5_04348 [Fulvia fulva]KAK4626578.1 hypothetical protein CLAFUR4_04370 [Fulvia fulva]KAK4627879.1 hypothetical protein CLAFUR0_04372 [Fulvia fulva]UJO16429.1 hypothetical protein CLAFUR5_04348 [Fulvia fulva]WPV14159.1 hypothetical protein CLAFUW4_04384 [Fulvia fulva]WPV28429.1 hypothetical protein CLAFUW7_04374 [Fulvia fulva]